MFVIFFIAHPSSDRRCFAATTHPYAPWPSSLTNWYSESTTKVEFRAWNEWRCIAMVVGDEDEMGEARGEQVIESLRMQHE
jgi:hypothetical protein